MTEHRLIDSTPAALELLSRHVGYLAATDRPQGTGWISATQLIDEAEPIASLLGAERSERMCRDLPAAASSLFEGFAVRLLAAPAALWQLCGGLPNLSPDTVHFRFRHDLPLEVAYRCDWLGDDGFDRFAQQVFESLVEPLADRIIDLVPLGRRLLWSNAAAAVATACLTVEATVEPSQQEEVRSAGAQFLASLPHDLAHLGSRLDLATDPPRAAWERSACCLWYREDPLRSVCNSCPLLEPADRHSRLTAAGPSKPLGVNP